MCVFFFWGAQGSFWPFGLGTRKKKKKKNKLFVNLNPASSSHAYK
jgi:hypothetical protein